MNRILKHFAALLLAAVLVQPVSAAVNFESIDPLPPGDQYRQLSLLMLITGGTDPALLELLQPVIDQQQAGARLDLELDDFVTPLIRIVDRETILASAAEMFRFAHENSAEIQAVCELSLDAEIKFHAQVFVHVIIVNYNIDHAEVCIEHFVFGIQRDDHETVSVAFIRTGCVDDAAGVRRDGERVASVGAGVGDHLGAGENRSHPGVG